MDGQIRSLTGLDTEEIASLALGGALYSTVNSMVNKYLPSTISSTMNSIPVLGPVLVPILAGMGIKFLGDKVPQAQVAKALDMVGEGLVGAAIVGAGVSLGQTIMPMIPGLAPAAPAAAPLSGVFYTPGMSGINYTPNMSGINYTPNMGIMPRLNGAQMGASADFGAADYGGDGGYVEGHKFSRADFGRMGEDADYGDEDPIGEENMCG